MLINKCIDIFIKGNLPIYNNHGGKGTAKGIFDGFDITQSYRFVMVCISNC